MQKQKIEVQEKGLTDFDRGYQIGHVVAQLDGVIKTLDRMIRKMEEIDEKYGNQCGNACKSPGKSDHNY